MKIQSLTRKAGFTLLETVIAIGVLTVLLTGFMVVFAPAAAGIKRAINIQTADRLSSTLEQELVNLRPNQTPTSAKTGFAKAYDWIQKSNEFTEALVVYQYYGSINAFRADGSPEPVTNIQDKLPGEDYRLQPMLRRKSDSLLKQDLPAVEGSLYYVKCTQLIFEEEELKSGKAGQIVDPKTGDSSADSDAYPEAVIAFSAEFYPMTNKNATAFDAAFKKAFEKTSIKPIFTRNLAVRR